jgi:hypothetical protein
MSIICKVDNSIHASLDDMHNHLRRFRIKRADYYSEYYPRKDKLTGEPIPFKDYNQYFSQEFLNKNNLKKWIKQNPKEGEIWAKNWLLERKQEKNLEYAPSQVELKSLACPSMAYYDSIGGYYNITSELGFKPRYTNQLLNFTALPQDVKIIVDTREQTPLKLPRECVSQKLDVGDYGLIEPHDKKIYIERKGLGDFIGTLSQGLARFEKEIKRAEKSGSYLVMLVEDNINHALGFDYLPQTRWVKASPSHIFKNLRDLLTKYPLCFQVVFADGRIDAAQKMLKIFEMGEQVKSIDLQYALERDLL